MLWQQECPLRHQESSPESNESLRMEHAPLKTVSAGHSLPPIDLPEKTIRDLESEEPERWDGLS
jgi:hypothetical protein